MNKMNKKDERLKAQAANIRFYQKENSRLIKERDLWRQRADIFQKLWVDKLLEDRQ